jgi:transposase
MQVTMIGLDLAKNVFQVHGVDAHERPVLRKRLSRSKVLEFFAQLPRCRVGIEACPGAHWWARQLLELGHDVRLMPPHTFARTSSGTRTMRRTQRRSARP